MKHYTLLGLIVMGLYLNLNSRPLTGDSLQYLTVRDTVFLELNGINEKIFVHTIAPKQTLYSLAKFYGLSVEELYVYNPGLKDRVTNPGLQVSVPIPNRAIKRYYVADKFGGVPHAPVFYRVKKGDSLYGICKRLFKMPMDTVMRRSGLVDANIQPGQLLRVGWMSTAGIPEEDQKLKSIPPAWRESEALRRRFEVAVRGLNVSQEKGVGTWPKEVNLPVGLYVLHRHAKLNSIIELTNPMNNRKVYARVMGKMPQIYTSNVKVLVTPKIVSLLGIRDNQFRTEIRYIK